MYTILVKNSNELIITRRETIMQKSKLVDKLHFLVEPYYKGIDMSEFSVFMEYILPVSKKYCSEYLILSEELYKSKLEYVLPLDTNLTSEAGEIELQLTFTRVYLDDDSNYIQQVRKVKPVIIEIEPIANWSDIVPDSALTAFDQRLIEIDSMIKEIEDINNTLSETKADDIEINNKNQIYLMANDKMIGRKWNIVVPKVNDGYYDGDYDGMLELDDIDETKKCPDSDGDGNGDNGDDGDCNCGCNHKFVELDDD